MQTTRIAPTNLLADAQIVDNDLQLEPSSFIDSMDSFSMDMSFFPDLSTFDDPVFEDQAASNLSLLASGMTSDLPGHWNSAVALNEEAIIYGSSPRCHNHSLLLARFWSIEHHPGLSHHLTRTPQPSRPRHDNKSAPKGTAPKYRVSKHKAPLSSPRNGSTTAAHRQQRAQYVMLGFIFASSGAGEDQYRCHASSCSSLTFGRLAELKRHNSCQHGGLDGKKPRFWCPIDGCDRSMGGERGAFPRKDKMMDHLTRVHADVIGC
ncbi:hypothetical protein FB567DRAFT_72822 [Paraphoma chrysanthemicola]|uniref:C2H2-domain containing protein second zinc finger domain-containing protein n=1 Tax=Paraphoma chrysanthemicola TaxID=798071 RepID=A0A8K0R6V4_9PLEO|nr:hypothetical protein FB567DRAFT_72822 [Paraphoma chrysanthemicola]